MESYKYLNFVAKMLNSDECDIYYEWDMCRTI